MRLQLRERERDLWHIYVCHRNATVPLRYYGFGFSKKAEKKLITLIYQKKTLREDEKELSFVIYIIKALPCST